MKLTENSLTAMVVFRLLQFEIKLICIAHKYSYFKVQRYFIKETK